jgi:hypothetical protein
MRLGGLICLFVLLTLLLSSASAVDCPPGFRWDRMSGVGCVQANCPDVNSPNSHWGYTGNCICGTDDCVGNPICVECYGPVDYGGFDKTKCGPFCPNVKLVTCVKAGTPCPGEKQATTTTKATTTTTATLSEKDIESIRNQTSKLNDAFYQNLVQPDEHNSLIARAGIGGDIGGLFDRAGSWLREGWNRIVPQDIIRVDDTDGLREWTIVGHDGSYVNVKIGGGTFKVDSEGIKIKLEGIKIDTSSGGGYVKGFTIGEIGVEQSFDPKEIATDKIKDKLTEDMPGAEPVSPDIDWNRIQQDIVDWFRSLKNEAYDALPEGLKEADEMTKHLRGGD